MEGSATESRHELADQVAVMLQRAYPGELTKDELLDESGLAQKDLSAALDSLSSEGELDPLAENFRWRDPTGEGNPPPDPSMPHPDQPLDSEAEPPLATELADPGGRTNRLTLEIAGAFALARGVDDEGTMRQAQRIAEEIQNILGTAIPGLGAVVTIRRLEVYDKPRVLFDGEVDEEQPEQ